MARIANAPAATITGAMPAVPAALSGRPWVGATADRILRTALVECQVATPWSSDMRLCASAPDPLSGERYICLAAGADGYRFDYSLAPQGQFDCSPPDFSGHTFTDWGNWTYVVDSGSAEHYVLFVAGYEPGPNTLCRLRVDVPNQTVETYTFPDSAVSPVGVWSTGELVWIFAGDGNLRSVALAEVLAGTASTMQTVAATGSVVAVTSDQSAGMPTYYATAFVQQPDDSWSLVQYVAGNPQQTTTVAQNITNPLRFGCVQEDAPTAIVSTCDGAVWRATPGGSPALELLVPSYPVAGVTQTWFDPAANANPDLLAAPIADGVVYMPLSASNVLILPHEIKPWADGMIYNRLGVGVLDQPPLPLPSYAGADAAAYATISEMLVLDSDGESTSADQDLRSQYAGLSAAQADAYLIALQGASAPSGIDQQAWARVSDELSFELYNLVSARSFWDKALTLNDLRDSVNNHALNYVANLVTIPASAIPIEERAGTVNLLTITGGVLGGGANVGAAIGVMLGATTAGAGFAFVAAGTAVVAVVVGVLAAKLSGWDVQINDPSFPIAVEVSRLEETLGPVFANTVQVINDSAAAATKDLGVLATVGDLYRAGFWSLNPPADVDPNTVVSEYPAYYTDCVVAYLQAFVPLIASVDVWQDGQSRPAYGDYARASDPITVTHEGTGYNCELVQQADRECNILGQDLSPILFDQFKIAPEDLFFNWKMPLSPTWPPYTKSDA